MTKGAAGEISYRLYLEDGIPKAGLSTDGSAEYALSGTAAAALDTWTHLAVTRAGSAVELVVDDSVVDTETVAGALYDNAIALVIGADAAAAGLFEGRIDEVRISSADKGDALGKVVVDYVYNARNQLVTETSGAEVRTYYYDKNGNAIEIIETVAGVEVCREEMTYDVLNRMLTHTGPKGTEEFTYRGAEWHRASANGTQFLYDGDNVLADIAGGGVAALYVTPFLDQNLSITKDPAGTPSTYYYSQDGLGSVRTLTDSAGGIANTYDYLPFGSPHQPRTNVTVEQRYTYTGREKNPSSALMYYRYRQYDPRVGRFGGRDPIGYAPLSRIHAYAYAGNHPVAMIDVYGLEFYWSGVHRTRTTTQLGGATGFGPGGFPTSSTTYETEEPIPPISTPLEGGGVGTMIAWNAVQVDITLGLKKVGDCCCITVERLDMIVDVYLTAEAKPSTLAHELGHALDLKNQYGKAMRDAEGMKYVLCPGTDDEVKTRAGEWAASQVMNAARHGSSGAHEGGHSNPAEDGYNNSSDGGAYTGNLLNQVSSGAGRGKKTDWRPGVAINVVLNGSCE